MAGQTALLSLVLQVTGHTFNTRFTPPSDQNMMKKIYFYTLFLLKENMLHAVFPPKQNDQLEQMSYDFTHKTSESNNSGV